MLPGTGGGLDIPVRPHFPVIWADRPEVNKAFFSAQLSQPVTEVRQLGVKAFRQWQILKLYVIYEVPGKGLVRLKEKKIEQSRG